VSKIEMLFLSRVSIKETTITSNKGITKQSMFGSGTRGLNHYMFQGEQMRIHNDELLQTLMEEGSGIRGLNHYMYQGEQMRVQHDELIQSLMEEAKQSRDNYLGWLENQQETARRESERLRNQFFIQAYGEIQEAEPLEREADAFVVEEANAFVVEEAEAEEAEARVCDENNEEYDWGELGPPPPPPVLKRQVAQRISEPEGEVIVLNGEYIVCD